MIVKVCGMRDAHNIAQVEQLLLHHPLEAWMGFIFHSASPRDVSKQPNYLPTQAKRVGVFVDAPLEQVLARKEEYRLHAVQLHGNESPQYISQLKASSPQSIIIKAIGVAHELPDTTPYEGQVDYLLFDTQKGTQSGGTGLRFDWAQLTNYQGRTPFILSGGISPQDATPLALIKSPLLSGIDLNSRFESAPAHKDIPLLHSFLNTINL